MSLQQPISFFAKILLAMGMIAIGWQAFSFATETPATAEVETREVVVDVPAAPAIAPADEPNPADLLLASAREADATPDGDNGFTVTHPLFVQGPLSHGEYVWNDEGVPEGDIRVVVDLSAEAIYVYRGGYEIGRAVVLYGYGDHPTPLGRFSITQKNEDHISNIYDVPMPYMMRLTNDGIAIHGSNVDEGAASHGCIGVPIEFAELLFRQAELGTQVLIQNESPYANGYTIAGI